MRTSHESPRRAMLRALVGDLDEASVWDVVADWLWERGDPLSEFARRQARLRELAVDDPERVFLMCYCSPGPFSGGRPGVEGGRRGRSTPAGGFFLGRHPVTQWEYRSVMGINPSHFSPTGAGRQAVSGLETDRFPVETVSWDEAVAFCRELSDRGHASGVLPPDRGYRLPSEAE